MSKRIRTFIAVELSPPVRDRLVELREALAPAIEEVKWVEPENIHLTLKFLGDVEEGDLYAVCKAAEAVAADRVPFEVVVAGVGAFPNERRPRVIWAGVTAGAAELTAIRDELEAVFAEQGFAREGRSYTPHLTLGRVRRPAPNPRLAPALQQQADWEGGRIMVREIVVVSSQLSPKGPRYAIMGRGRLGGS
jgi:2'-5' RNA ligase